MTHKPNGTQQERILKLLEAVRDGKHSIPEEYLRRHPSGDGISTRYIKQVMHISEANGRITELRGKLAARGLDIVPSTVKDPYGFCYQRLETIAPTLSMEDWFNNLPSVNNA